MICPEYLSYTRSSLISSCRLIKTHNDVALGGIQYSLLSVVEDSDLADTLGNNGYNP